jgi:hypothetical protein
MSLYNYGLEDEDGRASKEILHQLEKYGMQPPEVENPSQNVIDNCLSANYWEDEDE